MRSRVACVRLLLSVGFMLIGACRPVPEVPPEARRRLSQAIWPENLFDAAGRPEGSFVRRAFQPDSSDLRIQHVAAPPELPGVELYIGSAYPSGCDHCGTLRYAVARRDMAYVSILRPDDLQYLSPWLRAGAITDTTTLRAFVIAALRASFFPGDSVRQIRTRLEVPDADSPFLRSLSENHGRWQLPSTYSWQVRESAQVDFALLVPFEGIYAVHAAWDGTAMHGLNVTPVARYAMF